MQKTQNYGLNKPESTDFYNIEDMNENMDVLDAKLKEVEKTGTETNTSCGEHIENKENPHEVTKSQVGLSNVPNVSTNNQTPTYTVPTSDAELKSGEKLSVAFGKIAKAVSSLISHLSNKSNPHGVTKSQVGLGNVNNTSDIDKTVKHSGSSDAIVPILLTDEDLNDVTSDNVCFYYAAGSNKVKNNPENIGSTFGLICYRSALGWRVQELYSQYGNKFIRHCTSTDGTTWQEWQKVLTNEEGTWTPMIAESTGGVSSVYYLHSGKYKRVGNIVFATCKASLFRENNNACVHIDTNSFPYPIANAEVFIHGIMYNTYLGGNSLVEYVNHMRMLSTKSVSFNSSGPSNYLISFSYKIS